MKSKILLYGIAVLFICFSHASGQNLTDCDSCFSIDKLSENIQKSLEGHCTGFGFVIYHQGEIIKSVTHGSKRFKIDGGEEPFDNISKMHIASMSKTLTAICTLRLLARDHLTTYTGIEKYLPPDWKLGPNIDKLTFRRLMRHETGIRVTQDPNCNGETYGELQCKLREGVNLDSMDVYQYQNMNFALLRILIARLAGYEYAESNNDVNTARRYVRYVKEQIFKPCGLTDANCFPSKTDPVYCYNWPHEGGHGQLFYNYSKTCGAYGWFLSVTDYGKIINKLFNSEELLSDAWRDTMLTNNLGCYAYQGKKGNYYWHNGEWTWDDDNGSGKANSCWMYYPNNVIVVAMVNSDIPDWFPRILAKAYDNAWVNKK